MASNSSSAGGSPAPPELPQRTQPESSGDGDHLKEMIIASKILSILKGNTQKVKWAAMKAVASQLDAHFMTDFEFNQNLINIVNKSGRSGLSTSNKKSNSANANPKIKGPAKWKSNPKWINLQKRKETLNKSIKSLKATAEANKNGEGKGDEMTPELQEAVANIKALYAEEKILKQELKK
jgi:hypothetical protein